MFRFCRYPCRRSSIRTDGWSVTVGETMAKNVSGSMAASPGGSSRSPPRGVKRRQGSSPPARQTPGRGTGMARTEARLDATGAVIRRRSAGPWEPVEPRTDWARVEPPPRLRSNARPPRTTPKQPKCGGLGAARSQAVRTVASRVRAPDRHICRDSARLGTGEAVAARCGPRPSARDRPGAGSRARAERRLNRPTAAGAMGLTFVQPILRLLIGRSDDPHNPCRVAASKVSHPFGSGSRNPSGPAARAAQTEPALAKAGAGHTTATAPPKSSRLTPCTQGAVHTRPTC